MSALQSATKLGSLEYLNPGSYQLVLHSHELQQSDDASAVVEYCLMLLAAASAPTLVALSQSLSRIGCPAVKFLLVT